MKFEIFLIIALVTDWIVGDPKWFPHPVKFIGKLCLFLEKIFRKPILNEKISGVITTILTITISSGCTAIFLYLCGLVSENVQICGAVFVLYTFIAMQDLLAHSKIVYSHLVPVEDILAARTAVSYIVGRDTQYLDKKGVSRACVETVAENMVDGITAPLFWAILLSCIALKSPVEGISMAAIGITAYKAINTMDSMFGYKNDKYLHFGWFPARLDDVVNFLPARLSGLCVVLGSFVSNQDWRNSLKIFLRDRLNHTSPNAGHTEAAIAGALGVQLGGNSNYFGKIVKKPTIGDEIQSILPQDILRTHKNIIISSTIFVVFLFLVRKLCIFLFINF